MKRTIFVVIVVACLAGCATPQRPASMEEWQRTTVRTYESVSIEDVLESATKLVKLADTGKRDVHVVYGIDEVMISRKFSFYFVIGFVFATYDFHVRAVPQPNGSVKTSLMISMRSTSGTPTPVFVPNAGMGAGVGTTTMGNQWQAVGLYELFYSRLDYLLGTSSTWLTCDEAKDLLRGKGSLEGLCFFAEDLTPDSVPSSN